MEAVNLWQCFAPDSQKVIVQKQENFDFPLLASKSELQTPTLSYIPRVNAVRYYTNKNKINQTSITKAVKESKIEEESKPERKSIDNKNTDFKEDLNNLPTASMGALYGIKPTHKRFLSPYGPVELNKLNKKYQIDTRIPTIDNIQFTSSNQTPFSNSNSPNIDQSFEIFFQNYSKNQDFQDQLQNFSHLESKFKERPKTKNRSEVNDYFSQTNDFSQTQIQMNEIFDQNSIKNINMLAEVVCENSLMENVNKTDSNMLIQKGINDKDIFYENEVEINTENNEVEVDKNMVENFCQILNKKEVDIFSELSLDKFQITEEFLDYYEKFLDDINIEKTDAATKKNNVHHKKVTVNVNLKNLPAKSLRKIKKILNKTKVINVTKIKIKKPNLNKTKAKVKKNLIEKVDRQTFTYFDENNKITGHIESLLEIYQKVINQQSLLISQYENMIKKNDEHKVKNNDENIIKKDDEKIIKENKTDIDNNVVKKILTDIQNIETNENEDKKATNALPPRSISIPRRSVRISKNPERLVYEK